MTETRACALITGASDGIGAALARVFAAKGHELALVARRKEKLDALADEIASGSDKRPAVIALDLCERSADETLAAALAEAGLSVRYLVNNAGFGLIGRAIELDRAEQLAMLDLNMRALTALTLRFLPDIVAAKGGVLNVASVGAFMPGPGFSIYYATKAYVRSFSEGLYEEMKAEGVKVSCLCPGPVETGFQARAGFSFSGPMGAMKIALMPVEEVARQGYDGLMSGKRIVAPGFFSKLLAYGGELAPRALLLPILAATQKRR
ncbi:MAG: SDR family oxidoreductase [Methylocystis sp.]|nr:SDR family oxidoreductase [Methylocystis sp.]